MKNPDRILRELRWIKWLNVIVVACFSLIAGTMVWTSAQMSAAISNPEATAAFSERAPNLLEQGKAKEVVALSEDREKTHPMDPYVYWFRGKAYYQLGQYEDALKAMKRAGEVSPGWRESYTGPFIKGIKEELAKKK